MDTSRLTFSTLGSPELGFNEILALAASHGFKSIELRGILNETAIDKLTLLRPENSGKTAEVLADAGVDICVLGCSASFHGSHEASLAECRYAIEVAKRLGVPYIRVFGDKCSDDDTFSRVVAGLKTVCELVKGENIEFLLEAHGDFNTANVLEKLIKAVDSDHLGLLWDVEHTFLAGEDSREFANKMHKYIRHVHFKDVLSDRTLCLPGDGVLPLLTISDTLDSLGYSGLYSLEWEKRWHPELAGIEEALARYLELFK